MKTVEEIKAEIAKIQKYQEECEALIDTSDNPAIERLNLAQIEGCEDKITSLKWVLGEEQHFDDVTTVGNADVSEFQVDWSQAPEGFNWWAMDENGDCNWFIEEPYIEVDEWNIHLRASTVVYDVAPSFNCHGDWKDSLRERPKNDI